MKEKPIKYTIHFGETKSFIVNEWLYDYFNDCKTNSKKYNELYQILTGVIETKTSLKKLTTFRKTKTVTP